MRIIRALRGAGFDAYFAGGCVRDALLARKPKDFDVATSATPESVRDLFGKKKTLAFGASFGVIGVLPPESDHASNKSSIEPTEVATFRSDGEYSDGRRPDSVQYGTAEEDTKRRDFTINGLFYDPIDEKVIDFVGGQADLQAKVLRTIGVAADRFSEDKLRMLRAIRFSTVLGFSIDTLTLQAIQKYADQINVVSGERIGAEMRKVVSSPGAFDGMMRLRKSRLDAAIFPELERCDQDRMRASLSSLVSRDFVSAMACILISGNLTEDDLVNITKRWKLANEEKRQISAALKHVATIKNAADLPWSKVQPCLINRDAEVIVRVAAAIGQQDGSDGRGIELSESALSWPTEKLNPEPLVTGEDLAEAGISPGPKYKLILQTIRDRQLDGELNSKSAALGLAKSL